jgi:hypothetical protein
MFPLNAGLKAGSSTKSFPPKPSILKRRPQPPPTSRRLQRRESAANLIVDFCFVDSALQDHRNIRRHQLTYFVEGKEIDASSRAPSAQPWKSGPFRAALEMAVEAFRPCGRTPQGLKPSMFLLNAGLKAGSST